MADNAQVLTYRPLPGARLDMAHPLTRGLVGCWLLNENSGIRAMDLSPYGNHGTLTDFGSPPRRGFNGLVFDGVDDVVSIPHHNNQLLTTGGTICAWVNPASLGENNLARITDKSTGFDGNNGWRYFIAAGTPVRVGFTVNVGAIRYSASDAILSYNAWYFVAVTFTSAALVTHYVNGVLSGSPGATGALVGITTTTSLYIGNQSGLFFTWDGRIAGVWLYNRALNASEIQRLYLSPYEMFL